MNANKDLLRAVIALSFATPLVLMACRQKDNTPPTESSPQTAPAAATIPAGPSTAHVTLNATQGQQASGTLNLALADGGVKITGALAGLTPDSEHGFHVHQTGDCSAPDAASGGPHLNPDHKPHGKSGEGEHHAGDAPNIKADGDGRASVDIDIAGLELGTGGPKDVLGKAIVLHAKADDYKSQPAGDSGARIACGVVQPG